MKKQILCIALMGMGSLAFCACNKEAPMPATATHNTQREMADDEVYFENVYEFLDYFDALCDPGDFRTIGLATGGVFIYDLSDSPAPCEGHTYTNKDRLKFAQWCEKQLNAGKTLTIGKDQDGTFWADVKP